MPKLYVDTNVIIDAIKSRKNKRGKDVGRYAQALIMETISCKHTIIISTFTLYELKKIIKDGYESFFELLKRKLHVVSYSAEEQAYARGLSSNFDDALHYVIATNSGADCIVTRNVKDFEEFSFLVLRPEDLL